MPMMAEGRRGAAVPGARDYDILHLTAKIAHIFPAR